MGLQDKILDAVDNVNSLISFKMADLVNKAVKAGRYAEVFQDEGANEESAEAGQAENNWLQQLAQNYDLLRQHEKNKKGSRKFSSTFSPLMKFLKILEKKKPLNPVIEETKETKNEPEEDLAPTLLMAHGLVQSLSENKEKINKMAQALSFAKS